MKDAEDIANLFRQFGAQASDYQEITRAAEAEQSRERWPLLHAIEPGTPSQAPAVGAQPTAPAQEQMPESTRGLAMQPPQQTALQQAAPTQAPAAAQPAKRAEFIPPQPRRLRDLPSAFTRPPESASPAAPTAAAAQTPAPQPFVAQTPPQASAPATPVEPYLPPAAPPAVPAPAAQPAPAPGDELSQIFARLSQPARQPVSEPETRSASLLQRLNRL